MQSRHVGTKRLMEAILPREIALLFLAADASLRGGVGAFTSVNGSGALGAKSTSPTASEG
jgi:hypothetical protein